MAKEQLFKGYLSSALFLVQNYTGKSPFSIFLKEYFSANKKYGSRDRKYITQLCYCFFRSGHALRNVAPEQKMLDSLFLCSTEQNELLQNLRPELNEKASLPLKDKIGPLDPAFSIKDIFPWENELSNGIDFSSFCISHLIQPFLFLRIRPGYREAVLAKLHSHQILFEEIGEDCLAFHNTTKLDEILAINKEVVVQDFNSQRVGEFFKIVRWAEGQETDSLKRVRRGPSGTVWDCCAASGGKSIMLYDMTPGIQLTVSDIRENILANLKKRFAAAGIIGYKSFISDLSKNNYQLSSNSYQLIIADVPCTGSGTWSRTSEQLYFFEEKKIDEYASLQKNILKNVVASLLPDGYLLYITCSVFKKENEDAVKYLEQNFKLQLVKMELLKGYDKKADTLFAALLKK
ncbi:MAG: Fmu (Sun) domain-containing protein [Bacteroidota bacterium]